MGNFFQLWSPRSYQQQQAINSEQTSIDTSPTHEEVGSTNSYGHTDSHHTTTEMGTTVTENKEDCQQGKERKQHLSSSPTHEDADSAHSHSHTQHSTTNEGAEYRAVLACSDKLVIAISQDPLTISETLMAKGFISPVIHDKMLLPTSIPRKKATVLVTALREKIEVAPKRFHELMKIFSKLTWTKDIAEILQSAYQGTL